MKRLILRSVNVNKKTTTTCYRYNHFDTLGISKEASLNEIKLSFYKKAKELHPDVSSLDIEESTKKFIKLKLQKYENQELGCGQIFTENK